MRVVIGGATGFIGERLVQALASRGDVVVALTRSHRSVAAKRLASVPGVEVVEWRAAPGIGPFWEAVDGADAVVNLTGEPVIGRRWSVEQKQRILLSRVDSTRALVEAMHEAKQRPRVFVSASAVGYYGDRGDEVLPESAPPGTDFLADVCRQWEDAARAAERDGVREVRLRIGVVLGRGGGALERLIPIFRIYGGGPLGSGAQWMSWVHVDDVVGLVLHALDRDEVHGAVNAVAPDPRRNRDFMQALGDALHRPSWLPVPSFAMRLALGEAGGVLLGGQQVVPDAATSTGYAFRHPKLESALTTLVD